MDGAGTNGTTWRPGEKGGGPNIKKSYAKASIGPGIDQCEYKEGPSDEGHPI